MENLRRQIEADLAETLESEFAMPVEITSPDGETQIYKKNTTVLLSGQVLYFTRRENPETGETTIVVNMPVVTLRISSLDRVPAAGEKWFLRMAVSPVAGAPVLDWTFMCDRSSEDGTDIGFMRFYPQRLTDSESPAVSS